MLPQHRRRCRCRARRRRSPASPAARPCVPWTMTSAPTHDAGRDVGRAASRSAARRRRDRRPRCADPPRPPSTRNARLRAAAGRRLRARQRGRDVAGVPGPLVRAGGARRAAPPARRQSRPATLRARALIAVSRSSSSFCASRFDGRSSLAGTDAMYSISAVVARRARPASAIVRSTSMRSLSGTSSRLTYSPSVVASTLSSTLPASSAICGTRSGVASARQRPGRAGVAPLDQREQARRRLRLACRAASASAATARTSGAASPSRAISVGDHARIANRAQRLDRALAQSGARLPGVQLQHLERARSLPAHARRRPAWPAHRAPPAARGGDAPAASISTSGSAAFDAPDAPSAAAASSAAASSSPVSSAAHAHRACRRATAGRLASAAAFGLRPCRGFARRGSRRRLRFAGLGSAASADVAPSTRRARSLPERSPTRRARSRAPHPGAAAHFAFASARRTRPCRCGFAFAQQPEVGRRDDVRRASRWSSCSACARRTRAWPARCWSRRCASPSRACTAGRRRRSFFSPAVMSKNFTWISLSLSGCAKNAMYSMFHLPVSPFSSLGQILSVRRLLQRADERPLRRELHRQAVLGDDDLALEHVLGLRGRGGTAKANIGGGPAACKRVQSLVHV